MTWQVYWGCWALGYVREYDQETDVYDNWLFLGPLQLHWYSS